MFEADDMVNLKCKKMIFLSHPTIFTAILRPLRYCFSINF